jgi:predicted nucleotidyltransferase
MNSDAHGDITRILLHHFPDVQAIYLFGSYDTPLASDTSDIDIAILLPPAVAKIINGHQLLDAQCALEMALRRDVDLINIRMANMVFRNEVLNNARRIYCADLFAADEFEMLTMSLYQKLNEERSEIIDQIMQSGSVLSS